MNQPAPNKTFLQRTREIVSAVIARLDQYDIKEAEQEQILIDIQQQIEAILLYVQGKVSQQDYNAFLSDVNTQLQGLKNTKLDIEAFTSTISGLTNSVNTLLITQPKAVEITDVTQSAIAYTLYVANNTGLITINLPASGKMGDPIQVIGKGKGGWLVKAATGQVIHGTKDSAVSGNVTSKSRYDSIILTVTGVTGGNVTDWTLTDVQGNITIN